MTVEYLRLNIPHTPIILYLRDLRSPYRVAGLLLNMCECVGVSTCVCMRVNARVRVHVCVRAYPGEQLAEGCLETETPLDCILKVLRMKCSVLCC